MGESGAGVPRGIDDGGLAISKDIEPHVRDSHRSSKVPRPPNNFSQPVYSDVSLSGVTTVLPHAPGMCALGILKGGRP
jgi:hypothetical protein